ncbi:MAG TPA: type II toxin-antitoxin system VapC family toxin [Vicinamibacteria bacterium]|nr:type II toxin-antitoxin system VapC family toxin [Vicinamibacteria bacterium]
MKVLIDTSIYVGAVRSAEERSRFQATFFPLIPITYLSAVVAYELYVNARDRTTRRLVERFTKPMERTGRVASPLFTDWIAAARIVSTIQEEDRAFKSKLPRLLNDILIALSARRIGATLFTHNAQDFRLISRHLDYSLSVVE